MEALKNDYKLETGDELFNCVGCDELHSLSTIKQHATKKGKKNKSKGTCQEKYEAIGQWEILKDNTVKHQSKKTHMIRR